MLREDAATAEMIERALDISPDEPEVLVNKAKYLQVKGDLPAARAVLARIPPDTDNEQVEDLRVQQLVLERRFEEAARSQAEIASRRKDSPPADSWFSTQYLGWTRSLAGDVEGARQAYQAAKVGLETLQREQTGNPFIVSGLAFVEAGLGNKEAALREAERAVTLMPRSTDPVYGPIFEEYLAAVET